MLFLFLFSFRFLLILKLLILDLSKIFLLVALLDFIPFLLLIFNEDLITFFLIFFELILLFFLIGGYNRFIKLDIYGLSLLNPFLSLFLLISRLNRVFRGVIPLNIKIKRHIK